MKTERRQPIFTTRSDRESFHVRRCDKREQRMRARRIRAETISMAEKEVDVFVRTVIDRREAIAEAPVFDPTFGEAWPKSEQEKRAAADANALSEHRFRFSKSSSGRYCRRAQ